MSAGRGRVRRWVLWLAALVALSSGMLAVRPRLDDAHIALAYLLLVLGASAAGGRPLGLAIAGASFAAFNFLFLAPFHTFVVADPLDWIVLVAFVVTSGVATQLLYRANATAAAATQRAEEVDRLAALGAETLSAPSAEEALRAIVAVIRDAIGADLCAVYRRTGGRTLARAAYAARHPRGPAPPAEVRDPAPPGPLGIWQAVDEESLIGWSSDRGLSAVELVDGTFRLAPGPEPEAEPRAAADRLAALRYAVAGASPAVRALLLPLVVREQPVGVLRVATEAGIRLTAEQTRLLIALAYYAALGVERLRLVESAERAESERRVEALRSALLTAVSHDLRTPLTTIKAIAHEVAGGADPARAAVIEAEADWLDALVADLLDLSRIHAGAVRPDVAVNTADELVGAALQRAAGALRGRRVDVELPADDVLAGRFDFTQALRALVNLLENASKYAPAELPITVRARRAGYRLTIEVRDHGRGVPEAERERIFEPFYRLHGAPADVRGTGLGLAIARGLAEAQGGAVRHEAPAGGGSTFVLELPAAGPAPEP